MKQSAWNGAVRWLIVVLAVFIWAGQPSAVQANPNNDEETRVVVKSSYSQEEFTRLFPSEIAEIERAFQRGKDIRIGGFSGNMSTWLIQMADFDRRRTFRLIKDMGKLKTRQKRVARLKQEDTRVRKLIANVKKSIKRFEAKLAKRDTVPIRLALRAERSRLKRTLTFQEGLKKWMTSPMEGTRK